MIIEILKMGSTILNVPKRQANSWLFDFARKRQLVVLGRADNSNMVSEILNVPRPCVRLIIGNLLLPGNGELVELCGADDSNFEYASICP